MDGVRRAGARSARRPAVALASVTAAVALLAGGCGEDDASSDATAEPPGPGLRVEVAPPAAAPGEAVEARVVNETSTEFTYGLAYSLERREGSDFVEVSRPRIVPEIGLVAKPGDAGPPVRVRIPQDAEPGEYRIVIQRDVPDVGVLSGELAVEADR